MSAQRQFDVMVATLALLILLPVLLLIAVAIKLCDGGPIFYRQRRIGRDQQPFDMLKFRSMRPDAEKLQAQLMAQNEADGPVFKMKNDPRITPVGRFIRKHSLDELPQFINVLVGDMAIVGPRPPIPKEVERYQEWQKRRLTVRPGLTCLWQVTPNRPAIAFDNWVNLDLEYIDRRNVWFDLQLIARTVGVVVLGGSH
jgi:lipopolysaccharide/colanic/teichoic acid biosynthesis glycosyltransferase